MKTSKLVAASIVSVAASISTAHAEQPHSVAYYMKNEAAQKQMIKRCEADPDLTLRTVNCQNAHSAAFRKSTFVRSKPMSW